MATTTFGYKEVPSETVKEMNARITSKVGAWHGARMPWIHLMSLSSVCGYNELYSGDTSVGYELDYVRPKPIIESVEIRKQGELGTTKKATIKIKAFTDEQLDKLATCFFIPGMSVRVQYGWNIQAGGTRAPKPITEVLLDTEAVVKMDDLTTKFAGYEGLQGRIVNYSVNFAADESWDITVEVVGAASMLSEVSVKNHSMNCTCEDGSEVEATDEPKNTEVNTTNNLEAAYIELINQTPGALKGARKDEVYRLTYQAYDRDERGIEDTSGISFIVPITDGIGPQTETFISYGALEDLITYCIQDTTREGKPVDFQLDSSGVQLSVPRIKLPSQKVDLDTFCADPRVAYMPGGPLTLRYFDYKSRINRKPPLAYNFQDKTGTKLVASNILINVIHARKILAAMPKDQESVINYIQNLWRDINYACGNPWEIVVTAQKPENGKPTVLSITDIKPNLNKGQTEFVFRATAKASHVRNLGMDLKMTEAMKSQALYINQKNPPETSEPCNNRFGVLASGIGVFNRGMPTQTVKPTPVCTDKTESKCTDKPPETTFATKLADLMSTEKNKGVTNKNVESIRADMLKGVSGIAENKQKNCQDVPIPIELNVTIDGIGGFKFGMGVSCDRLPTVFRERLIHQITAVEHTITPTDWTTKINTIARLRS